MTIWQTKVPKFCTTLLFIMYIALQIYNVICAERPNSHKDSINTTAKRWQFKIHTLLENFAKHKCVIMPAAC